MERIPNMKRMSASEINRALNAVRRRMNSGENLIRAKTYPDEDELLEQARDLKEIKAERERKISIRMIT